MQLAFGNMTLELNIFHLSNKHKLVENDNQGTGEVCSVDPTAEKPLVNQKSPNEKKIDKNGPSMKATAQATTGVKELLLLDPP